MQYSKVIQGINLLYWKTPKILGVFFVKSSIYSKPMASTKYSSL